MRITLLQVPEWLHKTFHGVSVEGVSPQLAFITWVCAVVAIFLVVLIVLNNSVAFCTNSSYLKARIAELDSLEFKARNELLILKREIAEGKQNSSLMSSPGEPSVSDIHNLDIVVPMMSFLQRQICAHIIRIGDFQHRRDS